MQADCARLAERIEIEISHGESSSILEDRVRCEVNVQPFSEIHARALARWGEIGFRRACFRVIVGGSTGQVAA